MIGGLLFSYMASPHFDAHVKEFRLLADVFNDIGLTLDLALPILLTQTSSVFSKLSWISALSNYLPSSYLFLTSLSTLCKVACGICAGATKGNITDHFAISGNRADVNAKENTQETLVSLLGMILGVGLAKWLHSLEKKDYTSLEGDNLMMDTQLISWTIFMILTVIHIWANYVGIQRLQLRTLNEARGKVLLQQLVDDCGDWVVMRDAATRSFDDDMEFTMTIDRCEKRIKSPKHIKESLWSSLIGMIWKRDIHLGVRLSDVAKIPATNSPNYGVKNRKWGRETWHSYLEDEFGHEKYAILLDEQPIKSKSTISVVMKVGASDLDELKAFVHAHILHSSMQANADGTTVELSRLRLLVARSHEITDCLFKKGDKQIQTGVYPVDAIDLHDILSHLGWDMSRLYLGFSPWRCEWTNKDD